MSAHIPEGAAKAIPRLLILFFLIFTGAYMYEGQYAGVINFGLPEKAPNTIGTFYKVTKVTDGDTIRVQIDETEESVRLLGINTPETVDPRRTVECFGKEASERMKELAGGQIVRLEFDQSQGLRDAYNRLLAYVYLEDGQMLNRKMIAEGYAYEYTYMAPYQYQQEFRTLQKFAQSTGKGLWGEETCAGEK